MTGRSALIGGTGFVGSNLLRQRSFDSTYNSSSIPAIAGQSFSEVICAGVIAVKWWANQNADEDLRRIEGLIAHLDEMRCDRFVLISTVDVYGDCNGVTEDTPLQMEGLHAYGRNRARLERYIAERFSNRLIVRLPALFGTGLKKNAIFDLMHDNRLSFIHPESCFQWYPLARLAADLQRAAVLRLRLLNLAVEPLAMSRIAAQFFPSSRLGGDAQTPSHYDMRTRYADGFGGSNGYVVSADSALESIGAFVQSEAVL